MSSLKQLKRQTKSALRFAKMKWGDPVKLSNNGMRLLFFDSTRKRWIEATVHDFKAWCKK